MAGSNSAAVDAVGSCRRRRRRPVAGGHRVRRAVTTPVVAPGTVTQSHRCAVLPVTLAPPSRHRAGGGPADRPAWPPSKGRIR